MPRIVGFAGRGLRQLVRAAGFSAELANSFGAPSIRLPSLRDRSEDIPALLSHIVDNIARQSGASPAKLSPDLLYEAMKQPWLGNLIELHSAAQGLMENASDGPLHARDLEVALLHVRCDLHPRLLMRGLAGAKAELGIATMAYNLKRIMKVLGAAELTKTLHSS